MPLTTEQQELLQAKYDKLLNAVTSMSKFQVDWEKYRASSDRDRKRIWERNVDDQLQTEYKERKSKQGQIF